MHKTCEFEAVDGHRYTLRMSPKQHRYTVQREGNDQWTRLPSVTTLCKALSGFDGGRGMAYARKRIGDALYAQVGHVVTPQLADEVLGAAAAHRDGAADRGTLLHNWFEEHLSPEVGDAPLVEGYEAECLALASWADEWCIRALLREQIVCHVPEGYAGTLDLLAHYRDPDTGAEGLGIFDLKTGRGVYPENFAQMSGYWHALEWMGKPVPSDRFILHLPVDAIAVVVKRPWEPHDTDLTAFLSAKWIHNYKVVA